MKERPILFSTPMVRAILEGRKTMTRRIVKQAIDKVDPTPPWAICRANQSGWIGWYGKEPHDPNIEEFTREAYQHGFECPYGTIGDQLWVRETFYRGHGPTWGGHCIVFHADKSFRWHPGSGLDNYDLKQFDKKPSIFMPRHASRITLEITDIRVEQVRDISAQDCIAEGMHFSLNQDPCDMADQARNAFHALWDSINAKRGFGWDVNPWVWAISFRRLK